MPEKQAKSSQTAPAWSGLHLSLPTRSLLNIMRRMCLVGRLRCSPLDTRVFWLEFAYFSASCLSPYRATKPRPFAKFSESKVKLDRTRPCTPFPVDQGVSDLDRAQTLGLVAGAIADLVQDDVDGPKDGDLPGGDLLLPYCYILQASADVDKPVNTLGLLMRETFYGICLETSFQALVNKLAATDWSSEANQQGCKISQISLKEQNLLSTFAFKDVNFAC